MKCDACDSTVENVYKLLGTDYTLCSGECVEKVMNELPRSELQRLSDLTKLHFFTPTHTAH